MRSVTVFMTAMLFCCIAMAMAVQPENVKPYSMPHKDAVAQKLPYPHEVRLAPKRTLKVADAEPRIINGEDADEGKFPYYVLWDGFGRCGASLIHDDIILTAAHCGSPPPAGNDVVIGAYSLTKDYEKAETRQIERQCFHPNYDPISSAYDVMVLKINSPSSLRPVALNDDPASPSDGEELVTIGFGEIDNNPDTDTSPEVLQKVTLQAVSHDECNDAFDNTIMEEVMLCAGLHENGEGVCNGDSGGPLLKLRGGEYVQVGITSFRRGDCGIPNVPDVYTRISGINSWIHQRICQLSDNPPASCEKVGNDVPDDCGTIFEAYGECQVPDLPCCQKQNNACVVIEDFTTTYYDCPTHATGFFECQSCAIYLTGSDGQTQCNSCSICSGTVAFDCSNLGEGDCVIRACDGTCNPSDGGDGGDDGGGGDEGCEDVPGWHDGKGKDCKWYEKDDNCHDHGSGRKNDGYRAKEACCICGGGNVEGCMDVEGWHDGKGNDCAWYAEDHNCLDHGSGRENDGYRAKEACCVCGGGTVGGGGGGGDGGEEHGGLRKMKEELSIEDVHV